MKRSLFALLLIAVIVFSIRGCGKLGQIFGKVTNAAVKELKNQVQQLLEDKQLDVVEIKTAYGKLNEEGSKYQFFIAALVRADSESVPQSTANTIGKLFSEAGFNLQNESRLDNEHLIHKDITFTHADFSGGDYYVIWAYAADLSIDLPDLGKLLNPTK
ncbi:MAG: hypothetical protein IKK72_03715 [Oscillospiraceae bacterium]|nr:hypothetical protein [Oscillospiraceae bacterium]